MIEMVEKSIKDLLVAFQSAQLYGIGHPLFKQSLDKSYASINLVLKERNEFIIGIINEELIFEKDIFFELGKLVKPLIVYLKEREIEKIVFKAGLSLEELSKFITFLVTKKDELEVKPEEYLALNCVENIIIGKVRGSDEDALSLSGSMHKPVGDLKGYEYSLHKVGSSFDQILNKQKLDPTSLRLAVSGILDDLDMQFQHLTKLSAFKR